MYLYGCTVRLSRGYTGGRIWWLLNDLELADQQSSLLSVQKVKLGRLQSCALLAIQTNGDSYTEICELQASERQQTIYWAAVWPRVQSSSVGSLTLSANKHKGSERERERQLQKKTASSRWSCPPDRPDQTAWHSSAAHLPGQAGRTFFSRWDEQIQFQKSVLKTILPNSFLK